MKLSYDYLLDILYHSNNDISDLIEEKVAEVQSAVELLSEDEMLKSLGNKKKDALVSLLPLMNFIKKHVNSESVVYISQSASSENKIYNNSKTTHKWIERLVYCKCIYRLDIPYKVNDRAYYYYVYRENFDLLMQLCQKQTESTIDTVEKDVTNQNTSQTSTLSQTSFDHGLLPLDSIPHFYGSMNISDEYSKDKVVRSLHDYYPLLLVYQLLVNDLNQNIRFEEEKIKFAPKIHQSETGKYTKISVRATSAICSYTSIEKKLKRNPAFVPESKIKYREHYLEKRLGKNYKEFDIKASVPRVAHAVMLWMSKPYCQNAMGNLKEDIYKVLFEEFVPDIKTYFDCNIQTWEDARDIFKGMFMKLYFGGSVAQIRNSLINSEQAEYNKKRTKNLIDETHEYLPFSYLHKKLNILDSLIEKWKKSVDDYCGKRSNKNTEIFFHESCIYLEVRSILAERNIDVVQVYDGFYFAEKVPDDMEEIVHQAFYNYMTKINYHASYYAVELSKDNKDK